MCLIFVGKGRRRRYFNDENFVIYGITFPTPMVPHLKMWCAVRNTGIHVCICQCSPRPLIQSMLGGHGFGWGLWPHQSFWILSRSHMYNLYYVCLRSFLVVYLLNRHCLTKFFSSKAHWLPLLGKLMIVFHNLTWSKNKLYTCFKASQISKRNDKINFYELHSIS